MEKNIEMTPQQSLKLITETMNNSRKAILQGSANHFLLWGILLTALSLVIYFLWHGTGNPAWNFLWFAMPVIGYPLALLLRKREASIPKSEIGKLSGSVWTAFGAFAICLSIIAVSLVPMNVTLLIVVLLGFAECISGAILKNWPIIVAGFILGVGGAAAAMLLRSTEAQLLLFTLGGVLLAAIGVIVKMQYR